MHMYGLGDEIWSKKLSFYEYDIFSLKIDFERQFGIFHDYFRVLCFLGVFPVVGPRCPHAYLRFGERNMFTRTHIP